MALECPLLDLAELEVARELRVSRALDPRIYRPRPIDFFGKGGVSGVNLYSILVATLGSVVVLVIWHGIRGSRD